MNASYHIHGFKIDPATGSLTPIPGSPFSGVYLGVSVAVDSTGTFVYVADYVLDRVAAYRIDAVTGALTPVSGSPFAAGRAPTSLAVTGITIGSISNVIVGMQAASAVGGGPCIDSSGIAAALQSKLDEAKAYLAAGDIQDAIGSLNALLNQLQAQSGKHIVASCTANGVTFDPIAVLTAGVQALIASLKP